MVGGRITRKELTNDLDKFEGRVGSVILNNINLKIWYSARCKSILIDTPMKIVVPRLLKMWVEGKVRIPEEKERVR